MHLNDYSQLEEKFNIFSHAFGCFLSIVALILLVVTSMDEGGLLRILSFTTFGVSLICLYTASACYHSAMSAVKRQRLKVFDHAAIYVLIAGTYTPFTLVTLKGDVGWLLFIVTWGMAFTGIVLKLFFAGRYKVLSTIIYVLMGWLIVFAIQPLSENLPRAGLIWLVLGGVAYTLGAVFYSIKKIPFNHAIFHVFVLLGSFCHFISIYLYV